MTQYSLGDRVLVRAGFGSREGEVIEDRGDSVRIQMDDEDIGRLTVRKDRVRPLPPPRVAPIIPPPGPGAEMTLRHKLMTVDLADHAAYRAEQLEVVTGAVLRAVPKPPKRYENADYLKYVREQHACCCCGERPSARNPMVAHHHGPRGMSAKCDDTRTVPLLDGCHRYFHDHGVFRGTGAIGKWTREQTDECARYTQAALLVRYCKQQGIDTDNVIIEALTAALREA